MSETNVKTPTEALSEASAPQLPVVIEAVKRIYLHDVYTGCPGFVIILSERFNQLSKEESVSPDFSPFQELGYKVEIKHWHPTDRKFALGNNYDNLEGMLRSLVVHPENRDPIEEVILKGAEHTLLPMLAEMEADMEQQLDVEITRLQKIKGHAPK